MKGRRHACLPPRSSWRQWPPAAVLGVSSQTAGAEAKPPAAGERLHVRERHQARDLHPVRQHALPAGQPERAVGPGADAAPAQLHEGNGTLLTNDHTALISHTATGILTSLTGVYPDRMGQPVSNSFRYFKTDGTTRTGVTFAYWTAPLFDPAGPGTTDTTPEMINEDGKIAPAPWVPFTRAGCDVGSVAQRTRSWRTPRSTSPRCSAPARPRRPRRRRTRARRSPTSSASACTAPRARRLREPATHARPDLLPDEPGGYSGYKGLFGAKYVNPVIKPSGPMTDLDGNTIQDANGHAASPASTGCGRRTRSPTSPRCRRPAIPVTYAYISDAHDGHGTPEHPLRIRAGRGRLRAAAARLRQGVRKVLRPAGRGRHQQDEHAVRVHRGRGRPFRRRRSRTPAGCDGVTTPCNYETASARSTPTSAGMICTQYGDTTLFSVHSDDAPNVYVNGQPAPDRPRSAQPRTGDGRADWLNPYTGRRPEQRSWSRWPTRWR